MCVCTYAHVCYIYIYILILYHQTFRMLDFRYSCQALLPIRCQRMVA